MEEFDYNQVFMGVMPKRKKSYKLTFKDDYRLKYLTESLKLKNGIMLDMGCGGGILTESLVYYYPKVKIFGIDVSKTAIRYAKKFGSGKITYKVIKGKKIPFKDNFFDVCICLDVMEHIPDVNFFLKEVKRVLKKGGSFFLVVPCEGEPFTFTWLFQKIKIGRNLTYKNWGHIHPEFTQKKVVKLLEKYGFKIEKKNYSEHLLYQIANLVTYFLPKEIMDFILREGAAKYYDRGVVEREIRKGRKDLFDYIRKTWFFFGKIINGTASRIEIKFLKKVPFTAWKLHLLATVDKL